MKLLRASVLFVTALALAWLAGWGLHGDGLQLPAAVCSAVSLLVALAP
ncbi:MAG: hypothetical protein QOE06_2365 [Thermoleophilaceae bacterium]|nr:hypothetical protein [Thermoleophilaceae bacterium]